MTLHRRGLGLGLAALAAVTAGGCISVGSSGGAQISLQLRDAASAPARRAQPLVAALLIQPLPGNAFADTVSIAYSRRADEFAFYQLAGWTERPVRLLPRLLQRRLEARGLAGAAGLLGDPLHGDWLLTLAIDSLHHDLSTEPGVARLGLTVELFDRRHRSRVARRQFEAAVPSARADSAAAAAALSQAVGQALDELLPWLEDELQRVAAAPR